MKMILDIYGCKVANMKEIPSLFVFIDRIFENCLYTEEYCKITRVRLSNCSKTIDMTVDCCYNIIEF